MRHLTPETMAGRALLVAHPEWVRYCRIWHERTLKGRLVHWCEDWDRMPVDETVEQFRGCRCFPEEVVEEVRRNK